MAVVAPSSATIPGVRSSAANEGHLRTFLFPSFPSVSANPAVVAIVYDHLSTLIGHSSQIRPHLLRLWPNLHKDLQSVSRNKSQRPLLSSSITQSTTTACPSVSGGQILGLSILRSHDSSNSADKTNDESFGRSASPFSYCTHVCNQTMDLTLKIR